jgi:nicotinate-nucleotide pyrophosphorylase (carboxylating)
MNLTSPAVDKLVRLALAEDIGSGDITTSALVDPQCRGQAKVIAKQDLVIAGFRPFARVFELLNADTECVFHKKEGSFVNEGDTVAELRGPFNGLLTGERTALNFLQRLSGIATLTHCYAEKINSFRAVLLDTRKTAPGWRVLEKEAVRLGGGTNHRTGLFDGVLIKENHITASGGIRPAVEKAKKIKKSLLNIEVEVKNLEELRQALDAQPHLIMLDNMDLAEMKKAVEITDGRVLLEASGNVTLESIEPVAATGVDYISVGAITHSARAVDLSMIICVCVGETDDASCS